MMTMNGAGVVPPAREQVEGLDQVHVASDTSLAIGGITKRYFDIVLSSVCLVMLAPLFCLVALAVKLSSRGPVLYGHERVGHGGQMFKCWKFRTMCVDGDATLEAYLQDNPNERQEWETNRKLRNDPRVTRIGAVLRMTSVDELPQALNVLRGEMSMVGPRPVVQDELEKYGNAAALYLRARPGITGLWQVSGRSDVGYDQRVSLDSQYVVNWSLAHDIGIILRTIPAVISTKGSY